MQKSIALKEVSLFFGLTLGLSYLVFWGPLAFFQIPTISFVRGVTGPGWAIALLITGGFVPSLVAIFLTWKQGGSGLRQLGQRMLQFKIGWRWYLAAVAVVVISTLGQLATISLLGQTFDLALFPAQLSSAIPLIILGPLSEEIGWRGYALDRLQTKWNALVSSLMVGLVWGLWHGPLFYMVGTSQHELAMPFVGFGWGDGRVYSVYLVAQQHAREHMDGDFLSLGIHLFRSGGSEWGNTRAAVQLARVFAVLCCRSHHSHNLEAP